MMQGFRRIAPALAIALAATFAACEGCHPGTSASQPSADASGPPTFRLYLVTDLAGALEPCGCVKDQLGGLDHFAAWTKSDAAKAPESGVFLSGPFFFMDPVLKEDHRAQDVTKAETIAKSLAELHAIAFAPGKNDFAAGPSELEKLASLSGAQITAANLSPNGAPANWGAPFVKNLHGVNVGFFGVSALDKSEGGPPDGVAVKADIASAEEQVATLKKQGARAIICLAATGRGEAKRIADAIPDLTAIVVGSTGGRGEGNTETPPEDRVGNVIIAETGNHLTTVVALDLWVRGDGAFADLTATDASLPKPDASFFRYSIQEIHDTLGKDPGVTDQMLAYYKQVNDANKVAFADRVPRPAPAGSPSYIGVGECETCHSDAKDVWDKTAHAHAYATLSKQFKEFNLDCVGCHVTGYDTAGGSTVTHVDKLKDVQCEVCHGPGSLHAKKPKTVAMPTPKPTADTCLNCHHPPHVKEFDAKAKMDLILGPGHGKPS